MPVRLFYPHILGENLNMYVPPELPESRIQLELLSAVHDGFLKIETGRPEPVAIHDLSDVDPNALVAMTAKGLAEWETLATPNWDKFWSEESDDEECILVATTRERLSEILAAEHRWRIDVPMTWKQVAPLQASYVKQLPSGWSVTFRPVPRFSFPIEDPIESAKRTQSWWDWREITRWFEECGRSVLWKQYFGR